MPPKRNKNKNNADTGVKAEDPSTTSNDQTKPEEEPTQVVETKPEEQKAPENTTENKPAELSDSVVLVNNSIKSESNASPKKEQIPVNDEQEVKAESTQPAQQASTNVQESPQKVESQPVQEKAPEEHKAENQPEVKAEEPKKVESKPQEIEVPEVKKEEPKPETPKKVEAKAPEAKSEEKKEEPKQEAPKVETVAETKTVAANDSGKKVGAVQSSPEKNSEPVIVDGSIGKNFEVVTKPQDDDDASSDIAQAPSESRLLDDLSVPSVSQRSSIDTQPFVISKENSSSQPLILTFADRSLQAERLAAEAADLHKSKKYNEAIDKLKGAVDLLNPASLDKSETDAASKKVFEYSLKISENYFAATDFDQALNFSQIVNHADPANLGAALLISQVYINKGQDAEALKVLTNSLNKYGKKADQPENHRKALEEQTRLNNKLNPVQEKAPEPVPAKKEEVRNEEPTKKPDGQGSKNDIGYIAAGATLAGGLIGLGASFLLKLSSGKKILLTGSLALVSGLIAYNRSEDDQKKK